MPYVLSMNLGEICLPFPFNLNKRWLQRVGQAEINKSPVRLVLKSNNISSHLWQDNWKCPVRLVFRQNNISSHLSQELAVRIRAWGLIHCKETDVPKQAQAHVSSYPRSEPETAKMPFFFQSHSKIDFFLTLNLFEEADNLLLGVPAVIVESRHFKVNETKLWKLQRRSLANQRGEVLAKERSKLL